MLLVAFSSPFAIAQNPPVTPLAVEKCAQVAGYPKNHCATPGFEKSMTLEQIGAKPELWRDRIILHFGPSVMDVDLVASGLTEDGTPALAVPGGPACGIHMIVNGQINKKFCFTQSNLDRGEVGGLAERAFEINQKKKNR